MALVDFEKEFSDFVNTSGSSPIKDIYTIIPSLNQEQLQILLLLQYYIKKYDLLDLKVFLDNYLSNMKTNKNLNFLSSMNMKSLLKAYTQDELIRGIKVNSSTIKEE